MAYGTPDDDIITVTGGTGAADTPLEYVYAGQGVDRIIVDYHAMREAVFFALPSNSPGGGYFLDVFVGSRGSATQTLAARQFEQLTVTTGSGNDVVRLVGNDDIIATGDGSDYVRNRLAGGDPDAFAVHGRTRVDGGAGVDSAEVDWGDLGADSPVVLDTADPAGVTIGTGATQRYLRGIEVLSYFTTGAGNDNITVHGAEGLAPSPSGDSVPYQYIRTQGGDDTVTVRGRADNSGIGYFSIDLGAGSDDYLIVDLSDALERIDFSGSGGLTLNGTFVFAIQGVERVTVQGGLASDTVEGSSGNDVLGGAAGNDILIATAGHDTIDGGFGSDTLRFDTRLANGGYGAVVDATTFAFAPGGAGGYDGYVRFGDVDTSFTAIERFDIHGTSFADTITTGDGDDRILGDTGNDRIDGGAGNDVIDGGGGDDAMIGGAGDDIFVVDNPGDTVTEAANGGNDTVQTAISGYILPANVENLTYTGSGGTLIGTAASNVLTGGDGNDFFDLGQGGTDSASGGMGADAVFLGAALDAADAIDGGVGSDVLALQGNYAGYSFGPSNLSNIETLSLLPGSDTRFGAPGNVAYSYDLATVDTNVAAAQTLVVNANRLAVGENLTFNGAAETDGKFFVYGGLGIDTLTGGALSDAFFFGNGGQFQVTDQINGGAGSDVVGLQGNYATQLVFTAITITNVETLSLVSANDTRFGSSGAVYNYNIKTNDGNVAAGATLTVNANTLQANEKVTFDGSAETNGMFRFFLGAGNDVAIGGAGADQIYGGLGADTLTGGGGNDTFVYLTSTASTTSSQDHILDFTQGDMINLTSIDAITTNAAGTNDAFSFIGSSAFHNVAGELRASFDGANWLVEGDTNGDGVADLSILVTTTAGHAIVGADFWP